MTTSIGKLSKSFFVKLLVGIIILPFVFWGMGDVFRGGNQNVIATIDSKKVSAQEFVNYLERLNLNKEQIREMSKTNLIDRILSEYIGKKVMNLEIKKLNITVNDNSLRQIIKNDELFQKDKKFSRTEYEKFLIKSGVTAPTFESNIKEQESKRQLLSLLSGGFVVTDNLIEKEFRKENQTKTIKYIDLNKFYLKNAPNQKDITELYERNKKFFKEELRSFVYAKITPESLIGSSEYNQAFFDKLDVVENNVLDGQNFDTTIKKYNIKPIMFEKIDFEKKDKNKTVIKINDTLFKKIFSIELENTPEIIKINNNYYLVQVKLIEKKIKSIDDPEVLKAIKDQLNFQSKIETNSSLIKDIDMGGFKNNKLSEFASENNLELKDYVVSDLKDNKVFSEGIIKRIFLTEDNDINLITNSTLTKNFLIYTVKTEFKVLNKDTNEYERYEAKARLDLVNRVYKNFDSKLNDKYDVEINDRTIERIKNSFQ